VRVNPDSEFMEGLYHGDGLVVGRGAFPKVRWRSAEIPVCDPSWVPDTDKERGRDGERAWSFGTALPGPETDDGLKSEGEEP